MGGADAIRSATTLVVEANGTGYRLGQNFSPDADLPQVEIESARLEYDFVNHRRRLEDTRGNFLGNPVTSTAALDGNVAFAVGNDGSARRLPAAGASQQRAAYYFSALALMQAALAEDPEMAATVSNLRQDAMGYNAVDIATRDGVNLTLHLGRHDEPPRDDHHDGVRYEPWRCHRIGHIQRLAGDQRPNAAVGAVGQA